MTKASGLINQWRILSSQMFVLPSKTTSNTNYIPLVVVYLLDLKSSKCFDVFVGQFILFLSLYQQCFNLQTHVFVLS